MNLKDFMSEEEWQQIVDRITYKTCSKCGDTLPEEHFSMASGGKYRRSECRSCSKKLTKQLKDINVPPPPSDHVCPICLRNEEECRGAGGKKVGTWCKDHDHDTGEFRGYLCHQCNRGLGAFKDDVERIKRLLNYLLNYAEKKVNGSTN